MTVYERGRLVYLAAPYTHENSEVKRARRRMVTLVAHHLIRRGTLAYSPLTHNVPLSQIGIPEGPGAWKAHDHLMVSRSDCLLVLQLPGWSASVGVGWEIECAECLGIPVEMLPVPEEFDEQVQPEVDQLMRVLHEEEWETTCFDRMKALFNELKTFYRKRDWEQFHSPKNLCMTLASEVGELVEQFRWLSEEQSYAPKEREAIEDEVGDVFLVILSLADKLGLDFVEAARKKLRKMEARYPAERSRGKCLKYQHYV